MLPERAATRRARGSRGSTSSVTAAPPSPERSRRRARRRRPRSRRPAGWLARPRRRLGRPGPVHGTEQGVLQRLGRGDGRTGPRGARHQPRPRCLAAHGGSRPRGVDGGHELREGAGEAELSVEVARHRRVEEAPGPGQHEADLRAGTPGSSAADDQVPVDDPARRLVDVEQVHQAYGARHRGVVAQVDQRVGGVERADLGGADHQWGAAGDQVSGRDPEAAAKGLRQQQ